MPLAAPDQTSAVRPLRGAVAVPVKNEEERLPSCLDSLGRAIDAAQGHFECVALVILLNNCTDNSFARALEAASRLSCPVILKNVTFPTELSHAGAARSCAAGLAIDRLDDEAGIVLMTDADSEVATDWVAAHVRAFRNGAEVVAGRIAYDAADVSLWPANVSYQEAQEERYRHLLSRLGHLVDPDPFDAWPRHDHASGASLGFTVSAYRAAGGIPVIALGEDRAFVAAAKRAGRRVRHDSDVVVITSGRMTGRAIGGAADTILKRARGRHVMCDDRLEPLSDALRRFELRRDIRADFDRLRRRNIVRDKWSKRLKLTPADVCVADNAPTFAALWQLLEERSRILVRKPVSFDGLSVEIDAAHAAVAHASAARRRQQSMRKRSWRSDMSSCAKGRMADPNREAASSPLNG